MLSRLIPRSLPLHFRTLTLTLASSSSNLIPHHHHHLPNPNPRNPTSFDSLRPLSSSNGGDWKFTPQNDDIASIFNTKDDPAISGIADIADDGIADDESKEVGDVGGGGDSWLDEEEKGDIFDGIDKEIVAVNGGGEDGEWETADGYAPWSLGEGGDGDGEKEEGLEERTEEQMELERKEGELLATLKGEVFEF